MDLTRRELLKLGGSVFGGAAILRLVGCGGPSSDPALLLSDSLNPSLEGQKLIVRSLVERLAGEEGL